MFVQDYADEVIVTDMANIGISHLSSIQNNVIMVTGATGFIAYYIVLSLLLYNDKDHANNKIVLLYRNHDKAINKYGELLKRKDVVLLHQDVCDKIDFPYQVDYIIHAAGNADAASFERNPIGICKANIIGTDNIFQYAVEKGCCSCVYLSSYTVYGKASETDEILTEDQSSGEVDWASYKLCYPVAKRSGEMLCQCYQHEKNLPVKIVRPGFVYGPIEESDNRVYADIIRMAARNQNVILRSSGYIYRPLCYVTDLVRGIFSVLTEGIDGHAYNVAAEYVSVREYAEMVVSLSKDVDLVFEKESDAFCLPPSRVYGKMSTQKITEECHWKPKINLADGIRMALELSK